MFSSPAYAQSAGAASASGGFAAFTGLIPIILMVAIFYFLLIRPQQSKLKQHRLMVDALKKGDAIVTGGGVFGRVTKADGDEVEVEIAPNVRIRVLRGTISEVRDGAKPANDRA